jgi:diaminopimelate epimerase
MKTAFTKMHGAGNDFIVVDDRSATFPIDDSGFIARICDRGTGIGSDGVILLQRSETADFRMRFINPDGREVEMCGNGARCIARFAHDLGMAGGRMSIETVAGTVCAEVLENQIRIELTAPSDLQLDLDLGPDRTVDFVNTGVPHAVCWVEDAEAVDVQRRGAAIRRHPRFAPAGTNVNFARVEEDGSVTMRTYERGVEAETLACGTGAAAVAVLAAHRQRVVLPVTVHCAGGYDLVIDSGRRGTTLTGGACYVFTGEIDHGNRL